MIYGIPVVSGCLVLLRCDFDVVFGVCWYSGLVAELVLCGLMQYGCLL